MENLTATLLNTPGVVGVYNSTLPCSDFRSNASAALFKFWPERFFRFCCEDSTSHRYSLSNFTYAVDGARLISRPYFDLGNVESLSPYWRQYRFWQVPQTRIVLEGLKCEYTDLAHLYGHRFWQRVVKESAVTAAVVLLLLQALVVAFVVLYYWGILLFCHRREKMRVRICKDMKRWWWTKIKLEDWLSDLTHLYSLVSVGYALIEAVGHSNPIIWRPILFYNAAVVYTWLTVLSLLSSFLRQVAVSSFDESDDESKLREYAQMDLEKRYLSQDIPVPKETLHYIQTKTTNNPSLSRISEDWRWQRVFGQLAVLVLARAYLRFMEDESGTAMDSIAAIVFATMVVACIWSGGVGLVVAGRTVAYLWRHLMAMKLPKFKDGSDEAKRLKEIRVEASERVVTGSQRFSNTGFRQPNHSTQLIAKENGSSPIAVFHVPFVPRFGTSL